MPSDPPADDKPPIDAYRDELKTVGTELVRAKTSQERDKYAKLREAVGKFLTKATGKAAEAVASGYGADPATAASSSLAVEIATQALWNRFDDWCKRNNATAQLLDARDATQPEADRLEAQQELHTWLAGQLAPFAEQLSQVIKLQLDQREMVEELLRRVPDDSLAGLLQLPSARLPDAVGDRTPLTLLHPRFGIVPFDEASRATELAALADLCVDAAPGISLRLFTGPGGVGKTRLMLHFCKQLRQRPSSGWYAGFLSVEDQQGALHRLAKSDGPALVVIDYAEGRGLYPFLKGLVQQSLRHRVVLVLLARHAGDWWDTLAQGDGSVEPILRLQPFQMTSLPRRPGGREQHYNKARAAFATALHLGSTAPTQKAPRLDHARYSRPLYIHMAALLDLLQAGASDDIHPAGLPWKLVQREARVWHIQAAAGLPWEALRLLAAITLRGGAELETVEQLAPAVRASAINDDLLQRWMELYPRQSTAEPGIGALEPDLLGETLVFHVLGHKLTRRDFLDTVLDGTELHELQQALTVLGRIAVDHPEEARTWVRKVYAHDPLGRAPAGFEATLAVAEHHVDDVLGQELARALQSHASLTLAQAWRRRLPEHSVAIRELGLWVYSQLREAATTPEEKATALNNLGIRYGELGRREDALAATEEAVSQCRQLAQARPDAFHSNLASALNNLGMTQSNLGRREDALAATEEAVTIRRQLAQARPDAFLPDLATALNNLGMMQGNLGRREDALAATEEAVTIRRQLAQTRPDAFLPELARALNNLGIRYGELGRREDALAATEEAVSQCRQLAQARPDAFLPELARALNNLGACFSNLGRREDALAATEEAVSQYRQLAQARPDAFLPDLASALNNLGIRYGNLGRREDALAATEEAVSHYRQLAQARPDAFLPDLATALNNLSVDLGNLGRREDALATTEEAVTIRRQLAQARPDAFLPDLARALNNLGACFSNIGRREDALAATEKAVSHYRQLAQARPDAFLPDLATALNNLGNDYSDLGRREDALAATEEAVTIRRQLAQARPDTFLPDLATALNNLGIRCSNLGRREDALAATEEAVSQYRQLAEAQPDAFLPDLARALWNHSSRLEALGRVADALIVARESVAYYQPLAKRWPDVFASDLSSVEEIVARLVPHEGP